MELAVLLNKMLVFIGLMLIGYLLARKKVIDLTFTKAMSNLVINVFMVGTILSSMINTNLQESTSGIGHILMIVSVMEILGFVIAFLFMKLIHLDQDKAPVFEILMALGNNMFIALPIAQALYGSYAVFIVSISCIPFNVILYSYGVWRLQGGGKDRGIRFREILSPPFIATVAGILVILINLPIPVAVNDLLISLSGATMPLSMLVIGSALSSVSLLAAFQNLKLAFLSVVRLLIIPVISFFVLRMMTQDTVLLMTSFIIAAAPCAVIVSVLGMQYGQDYVFASEAVQHSTICSILTIPLLIEIFSGLC